MARQAIEESLAETIPPTVLSDAKLLVTELVTNSLQHAGLEPDESISLSVEVDEGSEVIRVTVSNPGPGFDLSDAVPTSSGVGGRGLHLVEQVAKRWGLTRDGTTAFWFELSTA
ncbi:MAG: ATP-binding protein [Actinomycetota bacterium]